MNQKIGIIGCGQVGSTLANQLYHSRAMDRDSIVLVNHNHGRAVSNVYDILDCDVSCNTSKLYAGTYDELANADVVVNCAGNSSLLRSKDRNSECANSERIARDIVHNLNEVKFEGVFINVMNPCDMMTALFGQLNLPHNKIIGTGTFLDTLRLRRIVYDEFNEVTHAVVVGNHGNENAIACSSLDVVSKLNQDYLLSRVRNRVWEIYDGKGYTSFGIANAATTLVCAVLDDREAEFPVTNFNAPALYDLDVSVVSVPCVIGSDGVNEVLKHRDVDEALHRMKEGKK